MSYKLNCETKITNHEQRYSAKRTLNGSGDVYKVTFESIVNAEKLSPERKEGKVLKVE